jgi:hypothetical protein
MAQLGGMPGRLRHGEGEVRYDAGNVYSGQWRLDRREG